MPGSGCGARKNAPRKKSESGSNQDRMNPEIKTLEDLFAWLEEQQPGYMKLEWQSYGMNRQQMLKRKKELGLNKKSRHDKVSNKYKETNNNDLRI